MHRIENERLRIEAKSKGAELCSLFDKKSGIEHLWQADPAVWGSHAPILFPVVGGCLNDQIIVDGRHYEMKRHGFARHSDFELIPEIDNRLHFRLSSSPATLAVYPYHFDFHIIYELIGLQLIQHYEVENKGSDTMFFSLGGHPAFAVPLLSGEQYEDYSVTFDRDTQLDREMIDGGGFFDGRQENVLNETSTLPLKKSMFSQDAIIFKKLASRRVTLRSSKNPHTLTVEFRDFHYLGLWAKVNAPYICIEPWLGCADTEGRQVEIKDKEGILSLEAGAKFHAQFSMALS